MADGCSVERELDGGRTVFRLSGTFDLASARALAERLEVEEPGELVLDFTRVDFGERGVSTLAHELALAARRRLLLGGLDRGQLRIFRYFGVDVEPLADEAAP